MKYDGQKKKSLDLNSTIEKSITLLKNLAIDGKDMGKSYADILGAKSEYKKVRVPKIKEDLPLFKIEIKPICSIGLPKWQEKKKLQKLSAENLKEKGLAWVPKGSIQAQKDYAQASGATKAKEREIQETIAKLEVCTKSSKSLVMASSIFSAYAYVEFIPWYAWLSLAPYFDPWYGSLCYGGLSNYFAYR
jgi:hypothetical protein